MSHLWQREVQSPHNPSTRSADWHSRVNPPTNKIVTRLTFPCICKTPIHHFSSQIPNASYISETSLSYQTSWSDTVWCETVSREGNEEELLSSAGVRMRLSRRA